MSLGFGFGSGLRALEAARLGMQTAGNNIANANTIGYSRQRLELSSAMSFQLGSGLQIGSGVDISGIFGIVDQGLERRLQLQRGFLGAAHVDQTRFNEIESIFGEPDNGLSQTMQDLFGSIATLQTDPGDRALRGGVMQASTSLTQGFRMIAERFDELGGSTFTEVRGMVRQVNERANAIADLNSQIVSLEGNGSTANDLRDTRAQHIQEISELLDARAIERSSGSVDLLVGGHLLVAGGQSNDISVGKGADGLTKVMAGGNAAPTTIREGRIAALLRQEASGVPQTMERVDRLARNIILEMNRLHTTGVARSGPFSSLTSAYGSVDGNANNIHGDEFLSQAGFEFDVQNGSLYVGVTNEATGQMERTRIDINPQAMTLQGVANAISGIDHLAASVGPTGKLRINADVGYGFDFSTRLDPNPDGLGTFGGLNPSIGSQSSGPYDISGQTFPVTFTVTTGSAASPVNTTVTLQAGDFVNPSAATTDELVAAINDDFGTEAEAHNIGGRLSIRTAQGGSSAQLTLTNGSGSVLGDLGMSTVMTSGRDNPLQVTIEGTYTGSQNDAYTFVAAGDGQIGNTNPLTVNVYDSQGTFITEIDVGSSYKPGDNIDIGNGVEVSFGAGFISGTEGQAFSLDVLADSDSSDLLVAIGMNSFFLGSSASDIEVDPALLADLDRLAAGLDTAPGDAGNLARFMGLRERDVTELDTNTIEDFYADLVGDVGFDTAAATSALQAQEQLMAHLQAERDSVSGVNIDEEMVSMLQYQQSYEAAARFIAVAQEMTDTLINLGR